jgi:hypothetical protein
MNAVDTLVRILIEALEPKGPFSNRASFVNSLSLAWQRFGWNLPIMIQARTPWSVTTRCKNTGFNPSNLVRKSTTFGSFRANRPTRDGDRARGAVGTTEQPTMSVRTNPGVYN